MAVRVIFMAVSGLTQRVEWNTQNLLARIPKTFSLTVEDTSHKVSIFLLDQSSISLIACIGRCLRMFFLVFLLVLKSDL